MNATGRIPTDANGGYAGEAENNGEAQAGPPMLEAENFAAIAATNPPLLPAIIDGVLREAAVATVIGGSKTRKSWLMAMLITACLKGGTWLGHPVAKGRVLLLDGELTRSTLFYRLKQVFTALGATNEEAGGLDVQVLRGRTKDLPKALAAAAAKGPHYYKLIIIDPLSCFYPDDPRFSENSNSDMRRVYDAIISFADHTRAAIVVVHHFSKGAQSDKSVVDLGAGAGAIARSGDAHIGLRAHKEPGAIVADMVVREFPENMPTCFRWEFPVFGAADDLSPLELAGAKAKKEKAAKAEKPPAMTAEEFARHYLADQPRELPYIVATAKRTIRSEREIKSLLDQSIALGIAYRWPGKSGNRGQKDRFGNTAPPPEILPTDAPQKTQRKKARKAA